MVCGKQTVSIKENCRKYANYKYCGQNINNLGDHIQILTIDYLYALMGIDKEDIIYIDVYELCAYDGPPVYLPVSMPLVNMNVHGVAGMFSKKITPIFFGITTPKDYLLPEEVAYYKLYEPIGCRDERAYQTMIKYGIEAYLGGCLTVTLPKRKECPEKQNKIFIVDVPESLKKHIPPQIAKNAIWDTHIYYGSMDDPTKRAALQYKTYREEASLMITGLLHGSVPCMAYGIPVVLARDCMSYRFAWLEALLKIYTPTEYDSIDWNPKAISFEEHKLRIRALFMKRMRGEDATEEISYTHDFYMNRNRHEYVVDVFYSIKEYIDREWIDHKKDYMYSVWGLTHMAEMTVQYIKEHYPNAVLTHVYDLKEGKPFEGLRAIHPNEIEKYPDEYVFVTTVSAAQTAKKYFSSINRPNNRYKTLEIIR